MDEWKGPIICVQRHGLYTLGEPNGRPDAATVLEVIEAAGPQPLPLPSRPLNRLQLSRWIRDWEKAGYVFRWQL
jgi:hypothetical protein